MAFLGDPLTIASQRDLLLVVWVQGEPCRGVLEALGVDVRLGIERALGQSNLPDLLRDLDHLRDDRDVLGEMVDVRDIVVRIVSHAVLQRLVVILLRALVMAISLVGAVVHIGRRRGLVVVRVMSWAQVECVQGRSVKRPDDDKHHQCGGDGSKEAVLVSRDLGPVSRERLPQLLDLHLKNR